MPFVGYMMSGNLKFNEGSMEMGSGIDYGVTVLVPVQRYIDIEVNYTRMGSTMVFEPFSDYTRTPLQLDTGEYKMSSNYFQLGVVGAITRKNPAIIPFGSFSVGATLFNVDEYSDTWRFSITAGLGAKFMFSEHIGLMLRARLMLPMAFSDNGGYCGVGTENTECVLTHDGFKALPQGDLQAGLIIKLGH